MRTTLLILIAASSAGAQMYPFPGPRNGPTTAAGSAVYTYAGLHAIATSGGAIAPTTGAINTTSHNFFVVTEYVYSLGTTPTPTDSQGLTWARCGTDTNSGGSFATIGIWYASGTGGASHTFSAPGANYSSISVSVYDRSGGAVTPCDQFSGTPAGSGTSLAPGSITPTVDGALVAAGCVGFHGSSTNSYASPLNLIDSLYDPSNLWGTHAYVVQTTATATNVPCTSADGSAVIAAQASFK